jgi:hypothetical protein
VDSLTPINKRKYKRQKKDLDSLYEMCHSFIEGSSRASFNYELPSATSVSATPSNFSILIFKN